MATPSTPSAVVVTVPDGTRVRVDALDLGVIAGIAKDAGVGWFDVVEAPLRGDGSIALAVYRAACALAKVKPPDRITTRVVYDAISVVKGDDIDDIMWVDGSPK